MLLEVSTSEINNRSEHTKRMQTTAFVYVQQRCVFKSTQTPPLSPSFPSCLSAKYKSAKSLYNHYSPDAAVTQNKLRIIPTLRLFILLPKVTAADFTCIKKIIIVFHSPSENNTPLHRRIQGRGHGVVFIYIPQKCI